MQETKKDRFKRIASARTNKILDMIKLLSNCSNEGNYAYTEEDIKKIFNTIESAIRTAKAKFSKNVTKNNKFQI